MKKKKGVFTRYSRQDKVLLTTGYVLLGLFVVAIIVPMIYIIVASFMDPITLQNKGITFDWSKWTTTAYERVMTNSQIWIGFKNAVVYSVVFTVVSVAVTLLAAYPLSRTDFKGKGFFNVIFMITMFFGGGLIPTYINMRNLHLTNNFLVYILPGGFSIYNCIIIRNYFFSIDKGMEEAANIDGASPLQVFVRIIMPLSKPVLATVSLWQIVGQWNAWFDNMIYTRSVPELTTLQYLLRRMLDTMQKKDAQNLIDVAGSNMDINPETVKAATTVIVVLPIIMVYPFLQKYFVKGIMVGAVKG